MRVALPDNHRFLCSVFTTDHLWYNHGPVLRRRHLKTNGDEPVHRFLGAIWCIKTCGDRCVVSTGDLFNYTLWSGATAFATDVVRWSLSSSRVVYEHHDGSIMSWDFDAVIPVARGRLIGASDERVLYDDGGRKWQTGLSADPVRWLLSNDVSLTEESSYQWPPRPYWIDYGKTTTWLACESRTALRLERLLNREGVLQLVKHA